jgi:hypothetical protein
MPLVVDEFDKIIDIHSGIELTSDIYYYNGKLYTLDILKKKISE